VILRSELAGDLPPATGDRVQLQQVILNLVRNASDAMAGVDERPRELLIRTEPDQENQVRLSVKDTGSVSDLVLRTSSSRLSIRRRRMEWESDCR
jgi:C4-dicarboxylate-specific signal transduction histidine kinase